MKTLPCIILCGGIGSRLGNVVNDIPKCLVEVNGKPFIYYQLKLLEYSGIRDVLLSIGHLSDMVKHYINSYNTNLNITYSDDGKELIGTGGAVKKALSLIDTPAAVMYGDTFLDISFKEVFKKFNKTKDPLMVIYKNNKQFDTSNAYIKNDYLAYNKSQPHPDANYIDYGLSIFSSEHFENTNDVFDLSIVQENYSRRKQLSFYIANNRFYEIGTPNSLKETEIYLSTYEFKSI